MTNFHVFQKDLDFRLKEYENKFQGKCPVHQSKDNLLSCSIYKTGHTITGYWQCRTRCCHQTFLPTPIGLIRGILSVKHRNWQDINNPKYSYQDTLNYIIKLTKWTKELHPKLLEQIKAEISKEIVKEVKRLHINKTQIREGLIIPSSYYLKRGISEEILRKYDVGDCLNPDKEMFNRAVIPLYNNSHTYAENFLGRRLDDSRYMAKWKTTGNINPKWWLFNSWFLEGESVILVESIGNALKLIDNGIQNVCAIFGNNIDKKQVEILKRKNIKNVTLIMDNDEGGRVGNIVIPKAMNNFNIKIPHIEWNGKNDVFELSKTEIEVMKGNI